ncbi:hypothetical protein D3C80_1526420 [compost metagenome]
MKKTVILKPMASAALKYPGSRTISSTINVPISTTNITGFLIRVTGFSFTRLSMAAARTIGPVSSFFFCTVLMYVLPLP